jgi:hypothetical protein
MVVFRPREPMALLAASAAPAAALAERLDH